MAKKGQITGSWGYQYSKNLEWKFILRAYKIHNLLFLTEFRS
jgi:hypothetical protein